MSVRNICIMVLCGFCPSWIFVFIYTTEKGILKTPTVTVEIFIAHFNPVNFGGLMFEHFMSIIVL